MGARLAHPEGLPNAPLLDEVVDALLDPHVRASHTATRTRDTFLAAAPRTLRSDRMKAEARPSFPLTTFLALQNRTAQYVELNRGSGAGGRLPARQASSVGRHRCWWEERRRLAVIAATWPTKCQLLGLK